MEPQYRAEAEAVACSMYSGRFMRVGENKNRLLKRRFLLCCFYLK